MQFQQWDLDKIDPNKDGFFAFNLFQERFIGENQVG